MGKSKKLSVEMYHGPYLDPSYYVQSSKNNYLYTDTIGLTCGMMPSDGLTMNANPRCWIYESHSPDGRWKKCKRLKTGRFQITRRYVQARVVNGKT